ncbi:Cation/H+ exchanger [Lasiodiplodia theobromae]|uniref:Putative Na(+)/H(+) antiporter n=1 Tax=Lasiodiplodia theobromae TaxID=45133 RepID=A0A5N5D346_9PEZI|nr:putative Na(+)/H(+) antiporter [Lasiodiplodia theobromae]KAF9634321.1 Cation/H+ exchanger [Lasiodiplodia theobromae]
MPQLELSQLNIVLSVTGAFLVLYGIISSKIKYSWYLGEALPATIIGIILGPTASKFVDSATWGEANEDTLHEITYGVSRVVIGIQLVIVGFQLPAKYPLIRWKEFAFGAAPVLTIMWLSTSVCVYVLIPKVTWLGSLVISSCVACNDSVLSQAIAKGPFADKYVPRRIRDSVSAEAGANDLFQFPMLMLATFLIRHAAAPGAGAANTEEISIISGADDVGRIGGGIGVALRMWVLETWLYTVLLSIAYGAVVGYLSCLAIKFALRRKWIDSENLFLFPTAIALFVLGTAGAIDTEDLLACFAAGIALNWNGIYQEECDNRHDGVNPTICSLLNYGGFLYIGTVMPWNEFNGSEITGISAIFFAEHTRHLFPELGEGDAEETSLIAALGPTVYWLVLFSIVVHGVSVPLLDFVYRKLGVSTIPHEDTLPLSRTPSLPRYSESTGSREATVVVEDKQVGKSSFETVSLEKVSWEDSWSADRKSSFDDDKKSLDVSDFKAEMKEFV